MKLKLIKNAYNFFTYKFQSSRGSGPSVTIKHFSQRSCTMPSYQENGNNKKNPLISILNITLKTKKISFIIKKD